jgi:endonuclease/exonuclease/phosphatase family metal-dependent hydrolase
VVTVMTRNLFLGADLRPVYRSLSSAEGLADVPGAVRAVFNPGEPPGLVQRTDFRTRAVAIASEVEAHRPDLIGVQEAALWRADGAVVDDHLEILERELADRGLRYRRVVEAENSGVELPSATGGIVGLTDREAILVRADRPELTVANPRAGSFANRLPIATARGMFAVKRGWASVDAHLPGGVLRFITTHLEVSSPPEARAVQELQMGELLDGPARTSLPVVMVGDFNARPGTATYERARAARFDDAWPRAHPDGPEGLTCCHRLPLDDPADRLRARIDLVLARGRLEVARAATVGDAPKDFTAGLWPSDHAGVVASYDGYSSLRQARGSSDSGFGVRSSRAEW